MRLNKPLALAASASLLVLAACGGGGGDEAKKAEAFKVSAKPVEKNAEAQGPAPEIEGAQQGGTVTLIHPDPDDGAASLDPTSGWSVTDNGIMQDLIFRSLTTYRQNQETGAMELVPDLATDLGTPNEDNTEWKFTIKDGVKWEDGKPVTAEDVAFGIKRSLDTESVEGPGAQYSAEYFLGGDKYKGPYVDGDNFEAVSVEGNTITIKMSKPFPDMDYWGAFAAIGPVPSGKAGQPPAYGLKPLSTGPYKVQKFTPNKEIILVRNEQWDPKTDPARHQYVDGWNIKFDEDTKASDKLMISNNDASKTTILTQLQGSSYTEAVKKLGKRVVVAPQTCTSFLYPDYKKIDNVDLRRAIAFAYDYENVWSAGGEIPGTTRVMGNSILPPGMAGYDKEMEPIPGEKVEFNPEKAKEYMKKAGVEEGTYELSWAYDASSPEGKDAMEQIKRGYEEAGFKTKAYPWTDGSLYDVWTDPNNDVNKKINIKGVAWCQDWPSPLTFIPALFQTGQLYNTGGFSEKSIDAEMKKIPSLPIEEQADAWGALDKKINQEFYPAVNIGYLNNLFVYGEKMGNFQNDDAQGYPNLKDIYIKK
ncbi:MAG TPA: ABC transporter substrate-binding protein [Nocardioides sp.]